MDEVWREMEEWDDADLSEVRVEPRPEYVETARFSNIIFRTGLIIMVSGFLLLFVLNPYFNSSLNFIGFLVIGGGTGFSVVSILVNWYVVKLRVMVRVTPTHKIGEGNQRVTDMDNLYLKDLKKKVKETFTNLTHNRPQIIDLLKQDDAFLSERLNDLMVLKEETTALKILVEADLDAVKYAMQVKSYISSSS